MPSRISPHKGGICLLGSVEEKEDLPPEAHEESEALIAEIFSEKRDVSLRKYSVSPLLQSSKYQPDKSLKEWTSRQLSHEQKTKNVGGCRVFYDPIVGYMEGLGKDDDWSHYCFRE